MDPTNASVIAQLEALVPIVKSLMVNPDDPTNPDAGPIAKLLADRQWLAGDESNVGQHLSDASSSPTTFTPGRIADFLGALSGISDAVNAASLTDWM